MSQLTRERSKRKFAKLMAEMRASLGRVDKEAFLQLVWAVWGLQQIEPNPVARGLVRHPPDAITNDYQSQFAVHPWELETLVNLLVAVRRAHSRDSISSNDFETAATFVNMLRSIEDAESGIYLKEGDIFHEMHRVGQRQFSWQRGFANRSDFYRSLFIYGLGEGGTFFEAQHGLSIESFTKIGFAFFAQFISQPLAPHPFDLWLLNIGEDVVARALALMATPLEETDAELANIIKQVGAERQPIAYLPSLLRRRPIILCGDNPQQRIRAPLPPLIMWRISTGLYYDLLAGGRSVRDEIARQFERYCSQLLAALMPAFEVEGEHRYIRRNQSDQMATPDILVSQERALVLVIECKTTKLTFPAQFAGDPALEAADKYEELAKGVFQLWRFFSHCRRGLTGRTVTAETRSLLLTLDTWLVASRPLQDHVLARARAKATEEPRMEPEDEHPVVFASIQDFESVLVKTDEKRLLELLSAAGEERFLGWILPNVVREIGDREPVNKAYPFELSDILPWWKEIKAMGPRPE